VGARLRLRKLAVIFGFAYVLQGDPVIGQTAASCPYEHGVPLGICSANARADPIPPAFGGRIIADASCRSTLLRALASLYSYDDPICHPANSSLVPELKYIGNAATFLPDYYKGLAENGNFHGTIYCDNPSNTLVLAFRGSVQLTPLLDHNLIADWYNTNLLQHLGFVPFEYGVASDVVQLITGQLADGKFDGLCGAGRPKIVLTGHSKGGGQAQYAAFHLMLAYHLMVEAVVFNSDIVNPLIFGDWVLSSDAPLILQWIKTTGRTFQSVTKCFANSDDNDLRQYYMTGTIRDVRMVNDPVVRYFLPYCSLPHADFEWLLDNSNCSANDGHGIVTVIRELQACAELVSRP
jgi:hypothetical protein